MAIKQIPLLLMIESQRWYFNQITFGSGARNKSYCTGVWQERLMETIKENLQAWISTGHYEKWINYQVIDMLVPVH